MPGGGRHGDVLPGGAELEPERAADVPGQDPHLLLRKAERAGEDHPGNVDPLARRVNCELFGFGVEAAHHPAALHGHVLMAVLSQIGPDDPVGAGEGAVDVAVGRGWRMDQHVAAQFLEDRRLARVEGSGLSHYGRQLVVVHLDQLSGVLSQVAALGHDQHDGVADQAHLVRGESAE